MKSVMSLLVLTATILVVNVNVSEAKAGHEHCHNGYSLATKHSHGGHSKTECVCFYPKFEHHGKCINCPHGFKAIKKAGSPSARCTRTHTPKHTHQSKYQKKQAAKTSRRHRKYSHKQVYKPHQQVYKPHQQVYKPHKQVYKPHKQVYKPKHQPHKPKHYPVDDHDDHHDHQGHVSNHYGHDHNNKYHMKKYHKNMYNKNMYNKNMNTPREPFKPVRRKGFKFTRKEYLQMQRWRAFIRFRRLGLFAGGLGQNVTLEDITGYKH